MDQADSFFFFSFLVVLQIFKSMQFNILFMKLTHLLVFFSIALFVVVGFVNAEQVTDGSFETTTTYTGTRCFIANGLLDFGECKKTGADQSFDIPQYWNMNTSIGDFAQILDTSLGALLGNSGAGSYSPTYGCFARNVDSYNSVAYNLTLYETCDAVYGSYDPLSVIDSLPYPYQENVVLTGSKALMIHNIPTMPCGDVAGSCEARNYSSNGFVWQNITLPNSSFILSYDVRNCDFTPPQCNEGYCIVSSFGNPRNPTRGNYRVAIANDSSFTNISLDIKQEAGYRDGWQHYDIYLSGAGLSGNYTLGLGIDSVSSSDSICVIYDNVSLSETPTISVPSTEYITDMNDIRNFPYTGVTDHIAGTLHSTSFKTSIGFDGVPQARAFLNWSRTPACSTGCNARQVKLVYTNGTILTLASDVIDSDLTSFISGNCWYNVNVTFPIFDYEDVEKIQFYNYQSGGNCELTYNLTINGDLSLRETYGDELSDSAIDDVVYADPLLYPVIIYNNYVNASGCNVWSAYNFKPSVESASNNVYYTQFSSTGVPKDYSYETISFPANGSIVDHGFCWMSDYESTDYIMINFTSESYSLKSGSQTLNTSVVFPVTASSVVGCTDRCIGDNYYDATVLTGGACMFDITYSSDECVESVPDYGEVPDDLVNITDTWNNFTSEAGAVVGQALDDSADNLPSTFKYIIAVVITIIVVISVGAETKSWQIALISAILMLFVFVMIRFVDWFVIVIIVIMVALLMASRMADFFTGGK